LRHISGGRGSRISVPSKPQDENTGHEVRRIAAWFALRIEVGARAALTDAYLRAPEFPAILD
jgi:hypothetical protein